MLNIAIWRGDAAPPFDPPASRAAAGAAGRRGHRPPNPVAGALMAPHRHGRRPRHAGGACRLARQGGGGERVGNNLNQLARWANTHAAVIAHLVSFERSLLAAMARFDGDGGDAH